MTTIATITPDEQPGPQPQPQPEAAAAEDHRLYLFLHTAEAVAARRAGVRNAATYITWSDDLAGRDVRIVAPRLDGYACANAHELALRAWRAGASSVWVIDPPLGRGQTLVGWFDHWTAEDLALMAEDPTMADEWRIWTPSITGEPAKVEVTTQERDVNDRVVAALAQDPGLFQRGGRLTILQGEPDASRRPGDGDLSPPPPRMVALGPAGLRERVASLVEFHRTRPRRDGSEEEYRVHPPEWCVAAVFNRGVYPGVRTLDGIVQAPTLRRDGSILDTPGYDAATGLLFLPNGRFAPIPDEPSAEDARAAAALLLDLVDEFPFVGPGDRALWLAALLTALGRPAFDGPAPLFGFDSNCPGTGKTLLADLVGVIALGRRIARTTLPAAAGGDDELRKRITSLALAGERITLLDNVDEPLGGAALDAALTATVWRDRVLGRSEMTPELPLHVVWLASGNNLRCRGDLLRRVLFARIEADVEAPERRQGFRRPDILGYAAAERPALLAAGLTILRAHRLTGCPSLVPALGSFEGWTRCIADAVAWATGIDPLAVRDRIAQADPGANIRRSLVAGWAELPGSDLGLTVAEALKILRTPGREGSFATLRAALMELGPGNDLPTPRLLGRQLSLIQGRVIGSLILRSQADRKGIGRWRVEPAGSAGLAPGQDLTTYGTLKLQTSKHLNPDAGCAGSLFTSSGGIESLSESA